MTIANETTFMGTDIKSRRDCAVQIEFVNGHIWTAWWEGTWDSYGNLWFRSVDDPRQIRAVNYDNVASFDLLANL